MLGMCGKIPMIFNISWVCMATQRGPLFQPHELAFRTQYAELKERVRSAGSLLPGTAGTLVKRTATGRSYWYRAYQSAGGKQVEDLVCRGGDEEAFDGAESDIEFSRWVATQVRTLRKLEFQVADKGVGHVLVELHNAGLLQAGLCLVGTLGYMALLNELGVRAVTSRTQDIDLAARQQLHLAAPKSFQEVLEKTRMGFHPVPALAPDGVSSSLKLPGAEGLRVDLLTHGKETGGLVAIPALEWHAQTVAHYDYLLEDAREAALLAGTHCVIVRVPAPERFMWHKFFSGLVRTSFAEKASKDVRQGALLAVVLANQDEGAVLEAAAQLPGSMRRLLRGQRKRFLGALDEAAQVRELLERAVEAT